MYRWVEWIRSRLRRVTGISTPLGGVTWQTTEASARQATADVRVKLVGPADHTHFVIMNVGEATAQDVQFVIELEDKQETPLVQGDYDEKLPIELLRPGDRVELLAALTFGSGSVFRAKWRWRNGDGELRERNERVSLQSTL